MANEVEVHISANEDVSQTVENVAESTRDSARIVVNSMGSTEEAFDTAARSSGRFGSALDMASGAGSQLGGAIGDLGDGINAVTDLQNSSETAARALARAQNDVEQAMADGAQAAGDLEQAVLDMNQAYLDNEQGAIDYEQAQVDANQAMIDATTAQTAYNDAVRDYGAGSVEAKQAANDLKQAQVDLNQANLDAEQATADMKQADEDSAQASRDKTQAQIDAKASALDLAEAEAEVAAQSSSWGTVATQAGLIAPVIMSVVGAIDLLILANTALHASWIRTTAAAIGARIAIIASTVATGIATAAQWLWNIAMMANPIGLIIAGIMLIVGVIIYLATQTTFFQDLWTAVWGYLEKPVKFMVDLVVGYVKFMWNVWSTVLGSIRDMLVWAFKSGIDFIVGYFNWFWSLPGRLWGVFKSVGDAIWQPLKWAFNMISWAWNNTAGRLSFRIPDWVPGVGGSGFSMPRLPMLAVGGDIVRTGMAVVHKGERIVPAGTAGLGTQGGGGNGVVEVRFVGAEGEFRRWLQKTTRVVGGTGKGNVQIAWG